jgi:hypothetical protein
MNELPTLFFNPSANEWNPEPYMAKEYTAYTEAGSSSPATRSSSSGRTSG